MTDIEAQDLRMFIANKIREIDLNGFHDIANQESRNIIDKRARLAAYIKILIFQFEKYDQTLVHSIITRINENVIAENNISLKSIFIENDSSDKQILKERINLNDYNFSEIKNILLDLNEAIQRDIDRNQGPAL